MTRYHTILVDKRTGLIPLPPSEAYPTHDEAVASIVASLSRTDHLHRDEHRKYEHRILLDVGSVDPADEDGMRTLLLADPLLSMIYKLGRRHQADEAVREARDYAQRSYPGLRDG
jgi:hypothetical protein